MDKLERANYLKAEVERMETFIWQVTAPYKTKRIWNNVMSLFIKKETRITSIFSREKDWHYKNAPIEIPEEFCQEIVDRVIERKEELETELKEMFF